MRAYQRLPRTLRRLWWTRLNPRVQLLRQLPKGSRGVEIGVWEGDYSAQILRIVQPSLLVLVDPWEFMPQYPESWHGGGIADGQDYMDYLFESVEQRFAEMPEVQVNRSHSVDAAVQYPDGHFDWAYIDGDHSFEAVAADLEVWSKKVGSGGLLTGDDYRESDLWWGGGVKRAVDEFVESGAADMLWNRRSQFILRVTSV